jgi:hypothetical protein
MKVFGGMPPWRLVAATHVSARPAYPQVDPSLMNFETLLATQRAWRDGLDSIQVGAFRVHRILCRNYCEWLATAIIALMQGRRITGVSTL